MRSRSHLFGNHKVDIKYVFRKKGYGQYSRYALKLHKQHIGDSSTFTFVWYGATNTICAIEEILDDYWKQQTVKSKSYEECIPHKVRCKNSKEQYSCKNKNEKKTSEN